MYSVLLKSRWLFFLIFICTGCWEHQPDEKRPFQVLRNPEPAESAFPADPIPFDQSYLDQLAKAQSLRDIFKVRWFMKFENHEKGTIARIEDMVFNGQYWFLLDGLQERVSQFTPEGKFVQILGRKGNGPGEYQEPLSIHAIYDDQIAITDMGKLLIFDENGKYQRTVQLNGEGMWFIPYYEIIWDTPERIYLADFIASPFDIDSPLNIILDLSKESARPVWGFGERFKLMEEANKHGIPVWGNKAFRKVGSRIWTGSPYHARLEIFDLEGRLLGEAKRPYANALSFEDFKDRNLTVKKINDLRNEKTHNENIFKVEDMVLTVAAGRWQNKTLSYDLFDTNGNLLAHGIKEDFPYTFIIHSFGSYIVSQFPIFERVEEYFEKCTPEELALLMQAGWDPDDYQTDNPYLVVGELIRPPGEELQ